MRDTVAAPIEEQVSGVEGMLYMSSRCTNDGAYNLLVTFKLGTNSDMAQVLVQNRVSLALPVIPPLVQNEGISVKKMSPKTMMIVNLVSPDGRYDATFLSNYATIYLKDELGRLPASPASRYFGQRDYSLRAWLDPDKLAALEPERRWTWSPPSPSRTSRWRPGRSASRPTPPGQQFQLTINTLGRLTDPEQFADIIVKTAQAARAAPLRDRLTAGQSGRAVTAAARQPAVDGDRRHRHRRSPRHAVSCRTPRRGRASSVGAQQYDQSCTLDGKPSVAMSIFQLPGSNALKPPRAFTRR